MFASTRKKHAPLEVQILGHGQVSVRDTRTGAKRIWQLAYGNIEGVCIVSARGQSAVTSHEIRVVKACLAD